MVLNLYGTAITDAGLEKLSGLKSLESLYLWQTQTTEEGIDKLRASLPNCKIVTGIQNWLEACVAPTELIVHVVVYPDYHNIAPKELNKHVPAARYYGNSNL